MLPKQKHLTFLRAVLLSAALPNAKPGGGRGVRFISAQRVKRGTLSSESQRENTVHGVICKGCFQLKPKCECCVSDYKTAWSRWCDAFGNKATLTDCNKRLRWIFCRVSSAVSSFWFRRSLLKSWKTVKLFPELLQIYRGSGGFSATFLAFVPEVMIYVKFSDGLTCDSIAVSNGDQTADGPLPALLGRHVENTLQLQNNNNKHNY